VHVNLNIPDELISEAQNISGEKSKTKAIIKQKKSIIF